VQSTDSDTIASFSVALKEASRDLHKKAENSRYMKRLLAGKLSIRRYADLVIQHYFVYQALEKAADVMRDDPIAAPFIRDELERLPALEADLRALLGDRWCTLAFPTDATHEYCRRIFDVGLSWPGGFVAHHYVRYMGDLSGGQFIKQKIEKAFGIGPESGSAFYTFAIPDPAAFKDRYRSLLEAAPWGVEERRRVIEEVLLAYQLNTRLLEEL
jgi:heme oxygenase